MRSNSRVISMCWIRTRLAERNKLPAPWKMSCSISTRMTRNRALQAKSRWWCSLQSRLMIIGINSTKEVPSEREAAEDRRFKGSFRMATLAKATWSWIQLLTTTSRTRAPTKLVASRKKQPILHILIWTNGKNMKRKKKAFRVSLQAQLKTKCKRSTG